MAMYTIFLRRYKTRIVGIVAPLTQALSRAHIIVTVITVTSQSAHVFTLAVHLPDMPPAPATRVEFEWIENQNLG